MADASSMNYLLCEGTWTTVNQILKYYDEDVYGKEDVFINGADGLYFIVLKTNREKKTFKIIKQ